MKYLVIFSMGYLACLWVKPKKQVELKSNIIADGDYKSISDFISSRKGEQVILSVLNRNKC